MPLLGCTLTAVDVHTSWVECQAVWGKREDKVRGMIHEVRKWLPFVCKGIDSDNGSEFINYELRRYCTEDEIPFTRARPYRKNDSAYVEQKNWSAARRLTGYDRYSSREAFEQLQYVHDPVRLYFNFFQPLMKLVSKTRDGAKVRKVYDKARTPYRRLPASEILLSRHVRISPRSTRSWIRLHFSIRSTTPWTGSGTRLSDEEQLVR